MKRKICVFTGTRADWGLLMPLARLIKGDASLCLQIIASGTHLSEEFGLTYKEIEKDGFIVDEKVDIYLRSDTPEGISKAMGRAMAKLPQAYSTLKPDILVGLGDRFELFCAVAAALVCRIPVAHVSGGDITEGVIDDSFRHAITKMSHLHFTATKRSAQRVIQLGEAPDRVFSVGEMGLDNINEGLLSRNELERDLGFKFKEMNFLVTFHPVTIEKGTSGKYIKNMLEVLDGFDKAMLIFTKANADAGGRIINQIMEEYVSKNRHKSVVFSSLGRLRYLSAMKYCDAVIGNSSSGIVEAPSFKIGTINIGDRQKGRERAVSVIDCGTSKSEIRSAIRTLYLPAFKKQLKYVKNPYGDGKSSEDVVRILKNFDLSGILIKKFYDLEAKR